MDDLDRPPLGAHAYEQIEVALYKVDTIYWGLLRPFQVFAPPIILQIISGSAPSPQGIPKRPLELIAILNAYARALFDTEFREYPSDPRLPHWMMKLAERTGDRVMRIVAELEVSSLLAKLSYHGVTASQMRETVDRTLNQAVQDHLAFDAHSQPTETARSQVAQPITRFRPLDQTYQIIEFDRREYELTPTQSTIIRVLHRAHVEKRGSVGIKEIQKALGVNSGKISQWFRGKNKSLYGKLIVQSAGRYHYRLDL
jgi:hypothetical protein